MTVQKFLLVIDEISTWCGKAAAWLIILLMAVVCVEVFKRYIMNSVPYSMLSMSKIHAVGAFSR